MDPDPHKINVDPHYCINHIPIPNLLGEREKEIKRMKIRKQRDRISKNEMMRQREGEKKATKNQEYMTD